MAHDQASPAHNVDAYSPAEVAARVETAGVGKANLPLVETFTLSVLAGAFIAFGGMFYTLVITDPGAAFGWGATRLLGGIAFSLGLVLVVVAGAELFTGNNLIVMAWADRRVTSAALLRNWGVVFAGNFLGAVATAMIVHLSGIMSMADGALAATARNIALAKIHLPFMEAFFRGLLCNTLVCLAVWMCFAARTVASKAVAILFPISAFVALGFEHSVANMYLIPAGYLAGAEGVTLARFGANLLPVTLGNVVGGSCFVALVYWIVYLRKGKAG